MKPRCVVLCLCLAVATAGTALSAAPSATTNAATNITSSGGQFNGTINPNGLTTTAYFQWGTTTSYGNSTGSGSFSGTSSLSINSVLSGASPGTTYHYRVVASSSGGTTFGGDVSFTTQSAAQAPPSATTNAATNITSSGAQFNGTINPNGASTSAYFQWGTSTSYGNSTGSGSFSGTSSLSINSVLSGASPGTIYHYRVVGSNSGGTTFGGDVSFTTQAAAQTPPSATTNAATNITSSGAQFNGTINPNGATTSAYFQWGTSTSYGNSTGSGSFSGTSSLSINSVLSGASPGTTYHYRVVASNSGGTTFGGDVSFTTLGQGPTVTTSAATNVTSTSATLNGTVNPNGSATTAHFEFGLSTSYGASTSNTSLGSGTSSLSVQAPTGAIQPGQTFHYRLVATNAAGTAYGNDVTFVTANDAPYALTNAATNVTSNSFQGNATINPNGLSTTSYFQYGLTTNYGSSNPSGTFTGSANLSVSATLNTNIQPNTTYHYRVVASSSAGTTYGNDVVLTTSGGPTPTPTATATATVPPSGSIAITGPAAVSAGGSATYRVLLASGSTQTDVTALSTLSFAQTPPTSAGIGGMGLFISRDGVTGTVYLQARYQNGGTQLTSPAFPVNIVTGLTGSFTANAQFQTGTTYQVSLDASAAGGTPPYTFRWDEDNDGAYQDATGQHVVFTLQSQGGTYSINLEVTDSSGVRMYAAQKLVIAKPPVASEPPNLKFPPDTKPSDFYTIGLGPVFPITPLVLDDAWKARSKNGLIVITHGIRSSAQSEWLATMAGTIRRKSNVDGPNIVLFDWNADADIRVPDDLKTYGADIIEATATLPNLFRPVVEEVVNAGSTAFEFAADILVSRTLGGPKAGRRLADWVLANTSGNTAAIDPSKPIQLIGHSAGGFCMGECAFQLKASGILVDLVTMLDTPMPFAYHINSEKSLGYVDRYISSIYGLLNLPPYIVSVDHYTVAGHYKYSPWDFHFYPSVLSPFDDGHGYSYLWYESTVFGNTADGFSLSPFGGGPRIDKTRLLRSVAAQARVSLLVSESDQAVSGFTGFGNVANTPGGFTLTEQADAGITQQMMLPVGAVSLKFRYRFIAGGDGDVISVNWNDQNALYVGEDLQLSRSDFVEAEVSLSGLSRRDGALSITLVSRGSPNAVVDIEDIRFGMSDDPDADGLSNDQEAALGTDPLRADTDGDGVKDGDEVNVYHTNPLLADTDGDGFSDGDETAAGTNPNDPQSFPRSHSSRLANISTRDAVGTGDNVLIGGFIIAGTQPKTVIVRGLGPSLTAFGISGVLADPVIEVYDSGGVLRGTNDNWKDSATSQQIAASGLAPTNELESALWGVINPGAYTVIVRGKDNSSGIGLFEVYDLDQSVDSRLANISTRGFVQAGDGALIAGSIVLGTLDSAANVLVRAVGPSLTANGVPNALQDPTLEIHDSDGNIVASDDNWRDSQEADIQSTGIPPSDDRESAILLRLSPAPYTAVMRGKDNAVGVGVIEAYHLNP